MRPHDIPTRTLHMHETPSPSAASAWHTLDVATVLARLESGPTGLGAEDAARRRLVTGPNRLPEAARRSELMRFLRQFHNVLIYVLCAAGALAAAVDHLLDAGVIFAVVLLNAAIGYLQEGRAERALEAIRRMIDPRAVILRDGQRITTDAADIVPGDVVLIEPGDRIPADLRLIRARGLRIDEAILTGESVAVDKRLEPVAADAALGARTCIAHSGTLVTAGQGAGVAVATGSASELGRITALIRTVESLETPLVRQMNEFARKVTVAILLGSIATFAFAVVLRGYALVEAFMVVVGLAVAAIPEGLPAVMTITLAIGVQRMATRHAIIRRLPAVETLGSVSTICSDKTGTLTRNEMTVQRLVTPAGSVTVSGTGYRPAGELTMADRSGDPLDERAIVDLLHAALLCNDASLRQVGSEWQVEGDPMEGALVTLAAKAGLDAEAVRRQIPRTDEIPFDAEHRFMATLNHGHSGETFVYVKGAPEHLLARCAFPPDDPYGPDFWHAATDALAAEGQRVIAFARKPLLGAQSVRFEDVASGLTLLGLAGLIDPAREEAIHALEECRAAGIAVKMITGDHAATARAIAAQLGLGDDPRVAIGAALDEVDATELRRLAHDTDVFARTTPLDKLRLVEALQASGAVVAMTGDGVNDAPALKRADVGIAMGRKGTEAAKEAADMVLADDNFASIVAAVREGRTVYDNLTKVIAWTLPTNGGESLTIILAILFGLTLPITAVQILWINLVTAVCLGLTLAFEPTEPATMRRPPRPAAQPLLSGRLLWRVVFVSVCVVSAAFGMFYEALARGAPLETARTIVVNTIVVMEIAYLFGVRYAHGTSITRVGALGTKAVWIGIAAVTAGQLAFTFAPPLQVAFGTTALTGSEAAAIFAAGATFLAVVEIEKAIDRRIGARPQAGQYNRRSTETDRQ